jgi:hypothetical protein
MKALALALLLAAPAHAEIYTYTHHFNGQVCSTMLFTLSRSTSAHTTCRSAAEYAAAQERTRVQQEAERQRDRDAFNAWSRCSEQRETADIRTINYACP